MFKITLIAFAFCFVLERIFVGWKLPKVHGWFTRVILVNVVQLGVVLLAGAWWEKWLAPYSLFKLSAGMSPWLAAFVAYFIATFVFYWWHRVRHESDFLWRHFHQIHHSPARLEVITSFYKHPHEMIVNSLLGSVLVYSILGLSLEAGALYTLFTALGEFFYHTNVKTPRWIGFIFQRPEMHRIHHEYNRHKNNYGDFTIWDMIFGTYENPVEWNGKCGFDEFREVRLLDMLKLKDVHKAVLAFALFATFATSHEALATSKPSEACSAAEQVVQDGDILFLEMPDFLFRKVAASTGSWTSHVGIVFKNEKGEPEVYESTIPLSKKGPLCDFIKSSANERFEIKRLRRSVSGDIGNSLTRVGVYDGLTSAEVVTMRNAAEKMLHKFYTLGFDFDSRFLYCSKFVHLTYQAIGVEAGKMLTFRELLDQLSNSNPTPHEIKEHERIVNFWRWWFLGQIPWERRTVTPASQLNDGKFVTVLERK